MCLAIAYGRNRQSGGTRLGRWLSDRPARSGGLAFSFVLAIRIFESVSCHA